MSCSPGTAKSIDGNNEVILKPDNEIIPPLPKAYHKNWYITGKVWIDALKTTLRRTIVRFTPHVPTEKDAPQRPPPMQYEDLPIYESPHYKYKQYIEDLKNNPRSDKKILQSFIFPIVHKYRRPLSESFCKMTRELKDMGNEKHEVFCKRMICFKKFMRDPDNLMIGRTVLGISTATGVYIGSGTRSVTRKLFGGTLGALSGGALCFPKETDVIFKDCLYIISRLAITLYNTTCEIKCSLKNQLKSPKNISTDSDT